MTFAKQGKPSALPPMTELAARCRDGELLRDIAVELGVAYTTLSARFSQAGFAATGETIQQMQRRKLRERLEQPERPDWMAKGSCLDHHPDLWYSDTGNAMQRAKGICAGCPSRKSCLEWAIETNEQWGIFGGHTRQERVNLKRRIDHQARKKAGEAA